MTYVRSNIKRDTRPDVGDRVRARAGRVSRALARLEEALRARSLFAGRDCAHARQPPSGKARPTLFRRGPRAASGSVRLVSGISPGRKVPKDNVNIAEPGRQSFFEHMAQQPNTDRATDAYEGAWLGNSKKLDDTNNRFTHDPSSRVYRGSRVAARINELGPNFMEGARGEGSTVAGHHPRHAGGMIKRNTTAQSGQTGARAWEFWTEADPAPPLNRGPKGPGARGEVGAAGHVRAAGARSERQVGLREARRGRHAPGAASL